MECIFLQAPVNIPCVSTECVHISEDGVELRNERDTFRKTQTWLFIMVKFRALDVDMLLTIGNVSFFKDVSSLPVTDSDTKMIITFFPLTSHNTQLKKVTVPLNCHPVLLCTVS